MSVTKVEHVYLYQSDCPLQSAFCLLCVPNEIRQTLITSYGYMAVNILDGFCVAS